MRDPATFDQAVCATTDPDLWFPDKGEHSTTAKALCRSCVHVTDCLLWALHWHVDGIWGATTPKERRQLRPQMGIIADNFYRSTPQGITFVERGQ